MPGMSITPSGLNVATMSSVRPSSSAWVYAAIAARTPSTTSAYSNALIVRSSSQTLFDDRAIERVHVHRLHRRRELVVGPAGEETVDRALEVGDVPLDALRQPHVFEPERVEPALLAGQVREVLRRDRRPTRVVARPHFGWRRSGPLVPVDVTRQRPQF